MNKFCFLILSCLILQVSFGTAYASHEDSSDKGVVFEGSGGR